MQSDKTNQETDLQKLSLKLAEQNEFLSYLAKCINFENSFDEEEAINSFLRSFGEEYNTQELLLRKLEHVPTLKRACGRTINKGETLFMCFDCDLVAPQEINGHYALQCKECFMSSNHEGHRITSRISGNNEGTCDCGDPNYWDSKGFCPSHPGITNEFINQTYQKIPELIRKRYVDSLKEIFYFSFDFLQDNPKHGELIDTAIALITRFHHLNDCFKLLTAEVLISKLPESYGLRVNLQNLTNFELTNEVKPCDCTFLELLIRFDFMFPEAVQNSIRSVLIELIVFPDFKDVHFRLYTRLLHFFYYMGTYPDFPTLCLSKTSFFVFQFFSTEKDLLTAVSYAESINFLEVVHLVLKNYFNVSKERFYSISFNGL